MSRSDRIEERRLPMSTPQRFPVTDFSTIGQFDITNVFTVLGGLAAILTVFSFMLTDFFDTMGTATAISEQAGLVDDEGQPKNVGRVDRRSEPVELRLHGRVIGPREVAHQAAFFALRSCGAR